VEGEYHFGVTGVDEMLLENLKKYILGIWTEFCFIVSSIGGVVVSTVMMNFSSIASFDKSVISFLNPVKCGTCGYLFDMFSDV
jgi:hypothetical protein